MMRYFTGSNVASNHLEVSPARDFKALVDRHINAACVINLTHEEFRSMPKAERDKQKRVSFLVPASFPASPATRLYENAGTCNLVFLDIDDGTHAQPYLSSPEALAEQMLPFNFVAYQTASSTAETPRIRIVVDAEGIPKEDYAAAVRTIAARIGLPHVTRESTVAVQPMFLPSLFADQDPTTTHPVFVAVLHQRSFAPSDIVADGLAPTYARSRADAPVGAANGDELAFLRATLPEITLELAQSALDSLSPDLRYHDWLEVAFALKHQFYHDCPDEAFTLFDEWSSRGHNYPGLGGREGTEAKWDSLKPSPLGRVPVTIRTLMRRAADAGWVRAEEAKELCYQSVCNWAAHEVNTGTELVAQGVSKIAAVPLLNHSEEEALLNVISSTAKTRFEMKVPLGALKKDLARIKALMKKGEEQVHQDTPPWAKHICYVSQTNEFYHTVLREKLNPERLNNTYSRQLMLSDEQIALSDSPTAAVKPIYLPQDFLLNKVKCPLVSDYIYDPKRWRETYIDYQNKQMVNTFNDTSYPRSEEEGSEEAGELFLEHLENLIAEPEYRRIVMDFMAFIVQNPGIKIRWAILLQGAQGCGKTLIVEAMRYMLGDSNVSLVDTTAIKGNYNEWAVGAQVVAIEEIRVQGMNKFDVMNVLKPLITNDRTPVNQKFKDTRTLFNISNYFALTNHHNAIAIDSDDRRYCVIKSKLQSKQAVKDLGKDYFRRIFKMVTEQGPALKWFFENWTISRDFDPDGQAPVTKYLEQVIQDSACELTAAVRRIIREGENPLVQSDLLSSNVLKSILAVEGVKYNDQLLGNILREESYVNIDKIQLAPGRREYFWRKHGMLNGTTDVAKVARTRAFSEDTSI